MGLGGLIVSNGDWASTIDSRKEHICRSLPSTVFNRRPRSESKEREHFITTPTWTMTGLWVPYANGVCSSPVALMYIWRIQRRSERSPRSMVGTHYHVGTVHGYTMRGYWRYLSMTGVAKPGTYIYEPQSEAHTLVITEDSPEPMMNVVRRSRRPHLSGQAGGWSRCCLRDGFTLLELTRKYYREAGLDSKKLDLLIR